MKKINEELIDKAFELRNKGCRIKDISKEIKVGEETIRKHLKKAGLNCKLKTW